MKKLSILLILLLISTLSYSQTIDQIEGTDISTLDQIEGTDISTLDQFDGSDLPVAGVFCPTSPAYDRYYDGELTAGANVICEDTGATTATPDSESPGVVITSGCFSGTGCIEIDTVDEHVSWPIADTTISEAGTLTLDIQVPASLGTTNFVEITTGGPGSFTEAIAFHYNPASNSLRGMHRTGPGGTSYTYSPQDLTTSTICQIQYSWTVAGGKHSTRACCDGTCDSEPWGTTNHALAAFALAGHWFSLGDERWNFGVSGTWQIDDVILERGYIGP